MALLPQSRRTAIKAASMMIFALFWATDASRLARLINGNAGLAGDKLSTLARIWGQGGGLDASHADGANHPRAARRAGQRRRRRDRGRRRRGARHRHE